MIFKRSPRFPLKQKRPPSMGLRLRTFCTRRARLGKPHRMSVWPVASHTRTPEGIGIIATHAYRSMRGEPRLMLGAGARLVGIEVGVVSGVCNLESPGVEAPGWRLRHERAYHAA